MKTYESKARLDIPADEVFALMATADYIQEEAFAIGAKEATATEKQRDDNSVTIIVNRKDPTKEPGAKPGKLEENEVTVVWDLKARKDTWKVKVRGKEKLVAIEGMTWIEPDGDGCMICEKGSVDIKVPMIGNMLAKSVVKDLKQNVSKKAKLIKKKLRG